jgi:hypothetical protein
MRPDAETLFAWAKAWEALRSAAYRELVASYTPEQRAIITRMHHAAHQKKLCYQRARWPEGATRKHVSLIVWPQEPPK